MDSCSLGQQSHGVAAVLLIGDRSDVRRSSRVKFSVSRGVSHLCDRG